MLPMTLAAPESPFPDLSTTPCPGFVVAMRAKLIGTGSTSRHEWMIVSRWGTGGEYLSIAWTSRPAHLGTAPIGLMPRYTALAIRQDRSTACLPATFALVSALPDRITVAGDFVPAKGSARVFGFGTKLRLLSEGQCLKPSFRAPWNVDAVRARWIGEFIEALPSGGSGEFSSIDLQAAKLE